MKRAYVFLALSLSAFLIVLPVISTVNDLASKYAGAGQVLMASGSPLSLPTPPPRSGVLTASGSPLPLPTPPSGTIAA